MVCMHLDENSRNNKPENLAWGTQKENLNAPGFIDYCKSKQKPNLNGKMEYQHNDRRWTSAIEPL
jgi:hypothetical protein